MKPWKRAWTSWSPQTSSRRSVWITAGSGRCFCATTKRWDMWCRRRSTQDHLVMSEYLCVCVTQDEIRPQKTRLDQKWPNQKIQDHDRPIRKEKTRPNETGKDKAKSINTRLHKTNLKMMKQEEEKIQEMTKSGKTRQD